MADVERLYAFLLDKNAEAASQAAQTISQASLVLESSPRIGRSMPDNTGRRELSVSFGAGAYVLRYILLEDDTVLIIRVWHSRENRG